MILQPNQNRLQLESFQRLKFVGDLSAFVFKFLSSWYDNLFCNPRIMHIYCSSFAQLFAELIGAFLAGIFSLYLSSTWTMEAQLGTQLSFGTWQGKSTSISIHSLLYRRKFRSQTSDNMDRLKAEMGRVREKRRVEERRSEKRKSQKKETADAQKGRKVAKHCVFPMMCGSGGSKSRLAKAAGAEPSGQMRWKIARLCGAKHISKSKRTKHTRSAPLLEVEMSKKRTPLWREAHFEVNMYKTHQARTTFGSCDVEKMHAVVARSKFRSQNVQNTPHTDHFWRFRCGFAWQARRILHLARSEQNMRVL